MALQPAPRDPVQLLLMLGGDRWRVAEHKPDAALLTSVHRVAQVRSLVASQIETVDLHDRFCTDGHEREAERPVGLWLVDLVESCNPVLPVAVGHELSGRNRDPVGRRDRVAKGEGGAPAEGVGDAFVAVEPVIARGSMHREVRDVVAAPVPEQVVQALTIGCRGTWRQHRAKELRQGDDDQPIADDREGGQKPVRPLRQRPVSGRAAGQRCE